LCTQCKKDGDLTTFAHRHSLDIWFLDQKHEAVYTAIDNECKKINTILETSFTNVIGPAPTKEAKDHMFQAANVFFRLVRNVVTMTLARSGAKSSAIQSPTYVLVRKSSSSPWSVRKYRDFLYNHVRSERNEHVADPAFTVHDFKLFASILQIEYEGPAVETKGTSATTFRSQSDELPYFPSAVPVTNRDTFWRWASTESSTDLVIASAIGLFYAFFHACATHDQSLDRNPLSSSSTDVDVDSFSRVLEQVRTVLLYRCFKKRTFTDTKDICDHAITKRWLTMFSSPETLWPDGAARTLQSVDYRRLAGMLNWKYLGTVQQREETPIIIEDATSKSVFHTVAWSTGTETVYASYLHLYMQLQRRQPTYAKLREAVQEGSTLQDLQQHYPSVLPELLEGLLADVTTAHVLDGYVTAFVNESAPTAGDDDMDAEAYTDKRKETTSSLTESAKKLRQENLCRQLDDLTRPWPILAGDHGRKVRRKTCLADQVLEGRLLHGYSLAERRGLRFLVREYQTVLLRYMKELSRTKQVSLFQSLLLLS